MRKIDIHHPAMGFNLCIAKAVAGPHQNGDIWKPQKDSFQQFDSIKTLYAPDETLVLQDDLPFVQFR
jgi:hypothetical protein